VSTLAITAAHRAARNQSSIDLASAGAQASSIRLYTAADGTLLAVCQLASPCATLTTEGRIALQPSAGNDMPAARPPEGGQAPSEGSATAAGVERGGNMVLASGAATWAEWCNGDGAAIAGGAVTDETGPGPFKLAGTAGTQLYQGGLVLLATPALIG